MGSESLTIMILLCGCKNIVAVVCKYTLNYLDEMVIWLVTEVD